VLRVHLQLDPVVGSRLGPVVTGRLLNHVAMLRESRAEPAGRVGCLGTGLVVGDCDGCGPRRCRYSAQGQSEKQRDLRDGAHVTGAHATQPDSVGHRTQYGAPGGLLNEDREPVCRLMQWLQFQHTGLECSQAMQLHDIVEGLQLTTAVFARADLRH
jgi:hypothetical protein